MGWEKKLAKMLLKDLATIGQRAVGAVLQTGQERAETVAKALAGGQAANKIRLEVVHRAIDDVDDTPKGKRH